MDSSGSEHRFFPGTPQHQKLLQAVVKRYNDDPRVRAVVLFGSLARGNWDRYSDLDLDVIINDDVAIEVGAEAEVLCETFLPISEPCALIVPSGPEAVDIVLLSRVGLSIRYHPLGTTSPNIIDSMLVLTGSLDSATIVNAGRARQFKPRSNAERLNTCIRYAVEVNVALKRNRPWLAIELLHRMRLLLMEIFASERDEPRAIQSFEVNASSELRCRLAATLPSFDQSVIRDAFLAMIDVLEHDLPQLTCATLTLTEVQCVLLRDVKRELASE